MKKLLQGFLSILFLVGTILTASVYVDGYTRSNGTYVEEHYRSSPNDTVSDNYSTDGNENSYTGEEGTNRSVYDDYSSRDSHIDGNNNSLIIVGIVVGVIVITILISIVTKNLFVGYLLFERKAVFWTWFILTIINQVAFFGACLQPYCILASIPHVSAITLLIMYMMYKSAVTTFDPETGYNYFSYDKNGYNEYGYDKFGYDRYGFNMKGIDHDGKDRKSKGSIARIFANSEYNTEIAGLNEEAISQNIIEQSKKNNKTVGANVKPNKPVEDQDKKTDMVRAKLDAHHVQLSNGWKRAGNRVKALDAQYKAEEVALRAELDASMKELEALLAETK